MSRYCLFSCALACIVLLVLGVSCKHLGRQFKTEVGDESVTLETHTGSEIGAGGLADPATEATGHLAFKPVSTAAPPPLEMQAVELAAKELAVNLRLLEEDDADRRAELEREMVSLCEQRRSLYQTRLEGK